MSGLVFLVVCVFIGVGYGALLTLFPDRFAVLGEKLNGRRVTSAEVRRIGIAFIGFGALAFVAIFALPLLTGKAL